MITLARFMSAARIGAGAVPGQPACAGLDLLEPPKGERNAVFSQLTQVREAWVLHTLSPI